MATTTTRSLDVRALQQLLAPYNPGPVDGEYGPLTAAAVKRAKKALGYRRCDGVAGPRLIALLKEKAAQSLTLREQIVANARWGIANEPQIHYEQLRPIDGLREPRKLPLRTDCSGFSTLCYAWAGAPDPNGLGYSGQGYTGTLLQHMKAIGEEAVQPGDLVVWGVPPGHHVALALEAGPDPLLCSHGQEKGPIAIRFSVESEFQPAPATWLSCLP
jgi:peptidoglycan hydrolase-like protein with peptidoglycan-binding domain